jgi:hypothetical protein
MLITVFTPLRGTDHEDVGDDTVVLRRTTVEFRAVVLPACPWIKRNVGPLRHWLKPLPQEKGGLLLPGTVDGDASKFSFSVHGFVLVWVGFQPFVDSRGKLAHVARGTAKWNDSGKGFTCHLESNGKCSLEVPSSRGGTVHARGLGRQDLSHHDSEGDGTSIVDLP